MKQGIKNSSKSHSNSYFGYGLLIIFVCVGFLALSFYFRRAPSTAPRDPFPQQVKTQGRRPVQSREQEKITQNPKAVHKPNIAMTVNTESALNETVSATTFPRKPAQNKYAKVEKKSARFYPEELTRIRNKNDVVAFLEKIRLEDPLDIRRASPVSKWSEEAANLAGKYYGELAWEETPQTPLGVEVEYFPAPKDDRIRGKIKTVISLKGIVIETREFEPTLGELEGADGAPKAWVLALNSRRYLQLYYIPNLRQWVGNYYMTNPFNNSLEYVGNTILRPVSPK